MHLSDLQVECYNNSLDAGWWEGKDCYGPNNCAVKIALIHSEISEALEGLRKNAMDDHLPHRSSLEVELGDAIIRILDLAGALNLDIEGAILEKMDYNKNRADHKPEARASENGKSF